MFIDLDREIVFLFLETEASGHAAAAVIQNFGLRTHGLKEPLLGINADDRFLVTMSVNDNVLSQAWWLVVLTRQEFGQSEGLAAQTPGMLVIRAQVEHLV